MENELFTHILVVEARTRTIQRSVMLLCVALFLLVHGLSEIRWMILTLDQKFSRYIRYQGPKPLGEAVSTSTETASNIPETRQTDASSRDTPAA